MSNRWHMYMYIFSFLYHCRDFDRTGLYIWVTRWASYSTHNQSVYLSWATGFIPIVGRARIVHCSSSMCCVVLCFVCLPLNRNESGRFSSLKSDSTHHFFRNACTKSGSLQFSQFSGCWLILFVYILMSFDFPFIRLLGVR